MFVSEYVLIMYFDRFFSVPVQTNHLSMKIKIFPLYEIDYCLHVNMILLEMGNPLIEFIQSFIVGESSFDVLGEL